MGGAVPVAGADIHDIGTVLVSVQQRRKRERGHYWKRILWGECQEDSLDRGKATTKRLRVTYP